MWLGTFLPPPGQITFSALPPRIVGRAVGEIALLAREFPRSE